MVHELRTPMSAVIGMAELLQITELSDRQRRMVRTIQTSTENLTDLVNDVLDFSKIESGKLELEHTSFDLRTCIEDCLDLFAAKAAEKGIALACEIDDATPGRLTADSTRIRQVLVNLLGNAIKFTESGEVVVSVTSRPTEGERLEIQFAVRDTGIGIPADRIEAIFDSYTQADESTTRRYGGTGLGLPISRQLCQLMGGGMRVESRVGAGSTFYFTIRCESNEGHDSSPRGVQQQLSGKRLVVVDDNPTVCRLLTEQARAWGMEVTAAQTGAECLQRLRDGERFDVAILGRRLADTDGSALATSIQRLLNGTSPQLIQLTDPYAKGPESSPEANGSSINQFAAYLAKPVKTRSYFETLSKALSQRSVEIREQNPADGPVPSGDENGMDSAAHDRRPLGERVPLRILVADDDDNVRSVAVRALERLGYEADAVTNGQEALDALAADTYDVLLSDVNMPEMDGLTMGTRIRQLRPLDPRPYIIASTAGSDTVGLERCLAAGMDDYLAKPWELQMLVDAIERAGAVLREHDEAAAAA
jgi:CheY-like chemotaxis protein